MADFEVTYSNGNGTPAIAVGDAVQFDINLDEGRNGTVTELVSGNQTSGTLRLSSSDQDDTWETGRGIYRYPSGWGAIVTGMTKLSTGASGTAAFTLATVTFASSGSPVVAGTAAFTLADATVSADGAPAVGGTAAFTLADAAVSADGVVPVWGEGAFILAGVDVVADGAIPPVGTVELFLGNLFVVGEGDAGQPPSIPATARRSNRYGPNHVTHRIQVTDFRPGMFSDFHAGVPPVTGSSMLLNGAAVVEDTWGCCADQAGSLVPLPRVSVGKTSGLVPPNPALHGTALPHTYLLDALVLDDVQQVGRPPGPEVVTLQTFIYAAGGFHDAYSLVRRWHEFKASPDTSDVSFAKSFAEGAGANQLLSGNLAPFRGWASDAYLPTESGAVRAIRRGFAWVVHSYIGTANPSTGNQFVQGAITASDQALTDYDTKYAVNFNDAYPARLRDGVYGYFPNFTAPPGVFMNSGNHFDGSSSNEFWGAFMCVGHQGRIVFAQRVPAEYENRFSGLYAWKDRVSATGLLRPDLFGGAGEFVEENTSGIGTMASLSAEELLVVKHSGGGYLLRGSVAAPTVTKLPFIESTGGVVSSPAATPIGLVYGSRHGVFVWEGGETSRHLSPQLDGFFWRHASVDYMGHRGRFGWWHPWVMAPGGYMYDTRNQSWWRLDNPNSHEAYNVFQVSGTGRLYAFPWRVTGDSPGDVVWSTADPDVLASTWSWKSQPLLESRDRAYKVRDVELVASAADAGSRFTVTLTGYTDEGVPVTFAPFDVMLASASDRPQIVKMDVPNQSTALTYIQVRIVAQGASGLPAPKLHAFTLGAVDTNPRP